MIVSLLKNPKIRMDAEFTAGSQDMLVIGKNPTTEIVFDGASAGECFEFILEESTARGFYFQDFDGEKFIFFGE